MSFEFEDQTRSPEISETEKIIQAADQARESELEDLLSNNESDFYDRAPLAVYDCLGNHHSVLHDGEVMDIAEGSNAGANWRRFLSAFKAVYEKRERPSPSPDFDELLQKLPAGNTQDVARRMMDIAGSRLN